MQEKIGIEENHSMFVDRTNWLRNVNAKLIEALYDVV
jgi:hypothetical protein